MNRIDMTKWQYNREKDVFWQTGIRYCSRPADEGYESLGIFVPGAYFSGTDNGDGTYSCKIDASGTVKRFTAETAPIVMPVYTPGYAAMKPPEGYADLTRAYTDAGFVCVYAGCRGRDAGAPAGVTDLKAAIRYIRYCGEGLPGNTDRIFTFGMSGGGAQSALIGATGDSELYTPYLEAIGAIGGVSDGVAGSMCWCPITGLDFANDAYEWNLGASRTDLSVEMRDLSDRMAQAFALHVNKLKLKDRDGNILTLTPSEHGIYQAGSYYDYLKTVIETSLNHFLEDTAFPHTVEKRRPGWFGGTGGMDLVGTYETADDYLRALNANGVWVNYDGDTHRATITSIADFVCALKPALKSVGSFDALNGTQIENILFGDGNGAGRHFDAVMTRLLEGTEYGAAFAEDLSHRDAFGNTVADRVNLYTPLFYLSDAYAGYRTSHVAPYWRIRTGINQVDTALTTEVNLALALENYGVKVDFETVWGQSHVEAERTGDSVTNFIAWVTDCCGILNLTPSSV
ncbi:MAG: tannase [Eubacteriales bacterium]